MDYLTYVKDINIESPSCDFLFVVYEFVGVFPIYLPSLPPNLDKDTAIDLYLGTRLISLSFYCISPVDLKKMNVQSQDLLGNRFIRLSVSP